MTETSMASENRTHAWARWLVAGVLLVCMGLQVWLLWARWINPDEGAHLMDARLVLEGQVPNVDYDARQPLYVYAYVPFLQLFGSNTLAGRLMPLVATWLTAWFLFLIGRRLWDTPRGVLAGLLFLCSPTILINAPLAKTEPLAILVTGVGMYALVVFLQGGRPAWLLFSGAVFGAGFYVRESTLAGALAASVVLLLTTRPLGLLLPRALLLFGGMVLSWLAVMLWYAQYFTWGQILQDGGLFPLHRIWLVLQEILGAGAGAGPDAAQVAAPLAGVVRPHSIQPWRQTLDNIIRPTWMNGPFVVAALIAGVSLVWRILPWRSKERLSDPALRGVLISMAWVASFALLYGYWVVKRGFFPFYFREFMPPLALLLAHVLYGALQKLELERNAAGWVAGGMLVLGLVYLGQPYLRDDGLLSAVVLSIVLGWLVAHPAFEKSGRAIYLGGAVLLLGWFLVMRPHEMSGPLGQVPRMAWMGLGLAAVAGMVWTCAPALRGVRVRALVLVMVLMVFSVRAGTVSARYLGLSYEAVWPKAVLRQVMQVMQAHSAPEDTVMSGAVIWEFEAGRQSFAMVTHPMMFRDGAPPDWLPAVWQELEERPPRIIVMDGYTEQSWVRVRPELSELLARDYRLVEQVEGGKAPVAIWVRSNRTEP